MMQFKAISKYVLAMFMIVAGTMHFVNPAFFMKIVPPYLPLHQELVLVSGALHSSGINQSFTCCVCRCKESSFCGRIGTQSPQS
jgi:uncharacterized membrane protein